MSTAVAYSLTGGPVSHQVLNRTTGSVVRSLEERGVKCLGISRGATAILEENPDCIFELTSAMFSKGDAMRGSPLVTERHLPRRSQFEHEYVLNTLGAQGVIADISPGGDGSFYAKSRMAQTNTHMRRYDKGIQRFVLLPRTMDGDFIEPQFCLGFATALHHGIAALRAFTGDCTIYGGPCVTKMMGRDAGWYALHCANGFGARMCLIPDEFPEESVDHHDLVDALVGHVLVSLMQDRSLSQILIAEGFWRVFTRQSQQILGMVRLGEDEHARIDYKDSPPINLAIADALKLRLDQLGVCYHGSLMSVQQRAVGYAQRQGAAVAEDLALAEEYGRWGVELALGSVHQFPPAVVALPNSKWLSFEEVEAEQERYVCPSISVDSPLFISSLREQRWLVPEMLEGECLDKLAVLTDLSPENFKQRFQKAAQFFAMRNTVASPAVS